MNSVIAKIKSVFKQRGTEQYGTECVTQLQHALQSAQLAEETGASASLITAALMHDIGHIFESPDLPNSCEDNLDDKHEFVANAWIKKHFGPEVADPIRLHVVAKRYLCTKDPTYEKTLSPTSLKSFRDQGGKMDAEEISQFETEPFFREALKLRQWDDLAKVKDKQTPPIDYFIPVLESCFKP